MKFDWRGERVSEEKLKKLAVAMGYVALRVERYAKAELYKGHGVITGTLRRSIHTATPGYAWGSDRAGGDLGGQHSDAKAVGTRLVVQAGSGLEYAKPVHDGHGRFGGYHYMTHGVDKTRGDVPTILREYAGD